MSVCKRQLGVCAVFAVLLAIAVGSFYAQDRRREWILRREQATHQLDMSFEVISREIHRVCTDALFLADQEMVRQFSAGEEQQREGVSTSFENFVNRKRTYDQIRLLSLDGVETLRVNFGVNGSSSVEVSQLQDKSDRYYFQESRALNRNEVFVSEFDLNLEHGQVELPLKPVIRFVTPVFADDGNAQALLVLNYLGAQLLNTLDDPTLPGKTLLLRADGQYLHGVRDTDAWGWLLDHEQSFPTAFPEEWSRINDLTECQLTRNGAFSVRRIHLGKQVARPHQLSAAFNPSPDDGDDNSIIVVSYLPKERVFSASNALLKRLLVLATCVLLLVAIFARYWAQATLARRLQALKIADSEERLRDLSSRLLRIQEDERRAISREIHDEFGQQVTAINLDLKLAQRNIDTDRVRPHLERAINENETLLHSLHEFAARVRPAVLDDHGLIDAVESHLVDFQKRTGIHVDTALNFESAEIPDEIADNSFRLIQESMNNVAKHANATEVRIAMSMQGLEKQRQFCISVCDNGCGYGKHPRRGLGLIGMRERVDLLSGEFQVTSNDRDGTQVEIRLPLINGKQRRTRGESEAN